MSLTTCMPQDCVQNCAKKIPYEENWQKMGYHELSESQVEKRETYSILNLNKYNQQMTRFKHIVNIDETLISSYRPPENV